jgi:hypothetical protein
MNDQSRFSVAALIAACAVWLNEKAQQFVVDQWV